MVQIIEENKRPTFAQKLNFGVGRGLEMGQQLMQDYQQKQSRAQQSRALSEQVGFDVSQYSPEIQQKIAENYFKQQFAPEKQMTPLQETQQRLAEERLKQLQSRQEMFNRLTGNAPEESSSQEMPQLSSQQKNVLSNMPEQNLQQLSAFAGQPGEEGIIGNIAKAELDKREKQEKEKRKQFEGERQFHTGFSKESEKEANQLRQSIPKKEMALNFARNAVETGELNYFSPDKLADATGIDLFRTAKGAQLITAGKENLLSNMGRVSARAQNIWFEQRLNSMFPKIGQSKEANLTVQEMLEGETALDKSYLETFDKIASEDEEKYGFVKKDVQKRVHQTMKPLEKEILKRTTYRMKEIEEIEKGLKILKNQVGKNVSKGTPLTLAMAKLYKEKFGENALKVAEKNGYYIPTLEEFKIFQQRPQEFREGLNE